MLQKPSWGVLERNVWADTVAAEEITGRAMARNPIGPSNMSVRDFIVAVGSADGAHGVVSTAAAAGGLGSSLLLMVAALPQTRSDSVADRTKLIEAATVLTEVQQQLIETIETETAVKLFTARHMPQASDAQRSERTAAIHLALRASADVPLEVMRLCARGLELAATVAAHSARPVSADVRLGVALLQAGFDGARSNLEGKLSSFTDAAYVTSVVNEIARLSADTGTAVRAAESFLKVRPA
jgi:formiminotetrahydrofolate cyclodeaminase